MKYKKIFLLVLSTLVLAACTNKPDNSSSNITSSSSEATSQLSSATTSSSSAAQSSSLSDTTSNSSSSTSDQQTTWKTEEIDLMESIVGEAIPYIKLADNYVCTFDTDEDGDYLYIYDESTTDLLTGYWTILENAGYISDGEETALDGSYTAYYYVKDDIVIQYNFYPGDDTYSSGNEIYAWIDDGGSTVGGVQTTDTSWPKDLSSAMTTMYGIELPFIALDAAYYYEFDDTTKEVLIADDSAINYLTQENYGQTLLDAGFVLEEVDDSYGYDVTTYSKAIDENYQIIVTIDFFPGNDTYSSGNEIYAYVDEIIHPVTSSTWPSEQIGTLLGATYNIPSFGVNGDYTYYTYAGGLYISGTVDADITEAYEAQAKENGLLMGYNIDYVNMQISYYIYDWEENFMVSYGFNEEDSSFEVYMLPAEATYDSLENTFPSNQIVAFLGEGKTEVPAFDCMEGSTYKVTMVEADPEFGLTAYLMITAIDNGTIGTDSIEDKYVTILETAGWTVDNTDYENTGYVATNDNDSVTLTFYTLDGLFYFYVEEASSIVADTGFDLSTSKAQVTTDTKTQVVYTLGQYTLTIDKSASQVDANNYLGNGVDHHETRVYKGQTMTIETTEGSLGIVVIETKSTVDA